MKISDLKNSGHAPSLFSAFLHFDISFMVWVILRRHCAVYHHRCPADRSQSAGDAVGADLQNCALHAGRQRPADDEAEPEAERRPAEERLQPADQTGHADDN